MISFRFPWYAIIAGFLLAIAGCILPTHTPLGFAAILGGGMLVFDGQSGTAVLPRLTPHASFEEDWREIECNLYLRGLGLSRLICGAFACIGLAVASKGIGGGDWQGWYMIATGTAWAVSWWIVALQAIRDALANDI